MPSFAIVAYRLHKTLSEHGTVSRGICETVSGRRLQTVTECTGLERNSGGVIRSSEGHFFTDDEPVSMNFWGFTVEVFPLLEAQFAEFLGVHARDPKAEFYIPTAVSEMIRRQDATVDVLETEARWFGVTYREDRPRVSEALAALHASGLYPTPLWKDGL